MIEGRKGKSISSAKQAMADEARAKLKGGSDSGDLPPEAEEKDGATFSLKIISVSCLPIVSPRLSFKEIDGASMYRQGSLAIR